MADSTELQCNSVVIFDLSSAFIEDPDLATIRAFLANVFQPCVVQNSTMHIYFRFLDHPEHDEICQGINNCLSVFKNLEISPNLLPYTIQEASKVVNDSDVVSKYSTALNQYFALTENFDCDENSVILLTNRIVDLKKNPVCFKGRLGGIIRGSNLSSKSSNG